VFSQALYTIQCGTLIFLDTPFMSNIIVLGAVIYR